ncbi:MAG: energy-coupling factor ABC transporter permease [Planctomycetota bacterium]|nr:energy-coupling factor ABC transporter permease [Planctomycetota bacterium]
MHIQDGYLSTSVCLATGVLSLGAVGYSLHRMKDSLGERTVPLTGMMGSLIFAGQMVNFPIGLPVSGHLMGGVLAAAILGPWAGCVAVTLVLVAQWALFSDGGLLALGANVLHMAVIGSIGGYAVMTTVRKLLGGGYRGTVAGSVVAAWLAVLAASAVFCLEFRLSYSAADFDFGNIFTLMVTLHALIGVGEAIITGFVVSVIYQQRSDLIDAAQTSRNSAAASVSRVVTAGLVCALAVAAFAAPFASGLPDGLDSVADRFRIAAADQSVSGLFTDYDTIPMAGWQSLSVSVAGIGGSLAVFAAALLIGRAIPMNSPTIAAEASGE